MPWSTWLRLGWCSPIVLTDWLVLIPVLALEVGAALGMVLVQSVSSPVTGHQTVPVIEQISVRHRHDQQAHGPR
jgi:H+/Cl- antiporter ClcA